MKLDSENQRTQLLELLGQVPIQATLGNIEAQAQAVSEILYPIRTADIQEDEPDAKEDPKQDTQDDCPDTQDDCPDTTPDISPAKDGSPDIDPERG